KKNIKRPKKPLLFYYAVALVVLIALNTLVLPKIFGQQLVEVDYGSFLKMIENGEVEDVQIDNDRNRIVFTLKDQKDDNIYFTALLLDLDLINRLLESGVVFKGTIHEELNPIVEILIGWIIPIAIFIG